MRHGKTSVALLGIAVLGLTWGCSGGGGADSEPASVPQASPSGATDQPGAGEHEHGPGEHHHEGGDASHGEHNHQGHAHPDDPQSTMDERIRAELAKLSPADARAVQQQRVCPVSQEALGSMGPPIKVSLDGREVWVCCPDCQESLQANPDAASPKRDNGQG